MPTGTGATPPDRPLRRDAQRNRDAILVAARRAFSRHGLHVPLEWIAKDGDVGIGTLYRNFPSRDALIEAVASEKLDEWLAIAEHALEAPDPWESLTRYLTLFCERQAEDRGFTDIAALRFSSSAHLRHGLDQIAHMTTQIVTRAKDAGVLRRDVEGNDLLLIMWGHSRVAEISQSVRPDIWRRYLGLLLDGLRAEHAHELPAGPIQPEEVHNMEKVATRPY
jgi:AcrR family transcriptional regulator